ncbi:iron-sulfur cluster assembly scaffold protein [Ensifer aridi]|uniref:iron-sulfur cluster assembly scaffold protein n=1 Tax=Ensifer aridi TaxID=1708715 RepID=UPI000A120126|nr:iron-sulfur cluster assembly scaffold protein [Ensifer aridi]
MWNSWEMVEEYFFDVMNARVLDAAKIGAISCSNSLEPMTRSDPVAEAITTAKSRLLRCSSAIASSSVFAERIFGTTGYEAHRLTYRETAGFIDIVPQERTHRPAMRFAASGNFRGMGRVWYREKALFCDSFSVDEGMIRRASEPTVSRPSRKSRTTRSLVAAQSRVPKLWKCPSGAMQQCLPKPSLRERRRVRKAKTPIDANSTYRITVKGTRSPEGCRACDTRGLRGDQAPSPRRAPRSRVYPPRSPLAGRATNEVEHTNVDVAPLRPRVHP